MKPLLTVLSLIAGLVLLAGCSTPESRIAKQPEAFARLTPDQQQMIKEGKVGVGFDMGMVQLALGDPDRIRERTDLNGKTEVWTYVTYESSDGMLLYRGYYHRGWGGYGYHPYGFYPYGYYPYYMDFGGRQERSRDEVVFREGRVISVEQERR